MSINPRLVIEQVLDNTDGVVLILDAYDVLEALNLDKKLLDTVFHLLQQAAESRHNYLNSPSDGTVLTAMFKESYALATEDTIEQIVALQHVFGG